MQKGSDGGVISHWYQLFEDFNISTLDFYTAVEEALKARQVPDIKTGRVFWKEKSVVSPKREYLRVESGRFAFDLCAAPYGQGFFFSWWLAKHPPKHPFLWGLLLLVGLGGYSKLLMDNYESWRMLALLILGIPILLGLIGKGFREGVFGPDEVILEIPYLGWLYNKIFKPNSYYRMDTALMFQESVRRAVMEVLDGLRNEKGLRALSVEERKPQIRDLAK